MNKDLKQLFMTFKLSLVRLEMRLLTFDLIILGYAVICGVVLFVVVCIMRNNFIDATWIDSCSMEQSPFSP